MSSKESKFVATTQAVQPILKLLQLSERLKFELRHSWLSNGRRESVAEHTWQMALMAMAMHRHLEHEVDLERSLKIVLVHDLVEALTTSFTPKWTSTAGTIASLKIFAMR